MPRPAWGERASEWKLVRVNNDTSEREGRWETDGNQFCHEGLIGRTFEEKPSSSEDRFDVIRR